MCQWSNADHANRKYWRYIEISEVGRTGLKCCPAAKGGYQLFRQQALAEALAVVEETPYAFTASCVAYDEGNSTLVECMSEAGVDNFTRTWGSLFSGNASFETFTHQTWVQWVREHGRQTWQQDWLCYIQDRYGY
jgi:hypothetical protein